MSIGLTNRIHEVIYGDADWNYVHGAHGHEQRSRQRNSDQQTNIEHCILVMLASVCVNYPSVWSVREVHQVISCFGSPNPVYHIILSYNRARFDMLNDRIARIKSMSNTHCNRTPK